MNVFQMNTSYGELFTMPYALMSKAMTMAHRNLEGVLDANRTLAEAMQSNLRKQQDVALELTTELMRSYTGAVRSAGKIDDSAASVSTPFELGQKMLDAQLSTLRSFGLKHGKGV